MKCVRKLDFVTFQISENHLLDSKWILRTEDEQGIFGSSVQASLPQELSAQGILLQLLLSFFFRQRLFQFFSSLKSLKIRRINEITIWEWITECWKVRVHTQLIWKAIHFSQRISEKSWNMITVRMVSKLANFFLKIDKNPTLANCSLA